MSVKNLCKDSKDIENTIEMLLQDQKRLVQEEKRRAESAINNFANAAKLIPLPITRKISRKLEKEATRIIPKRVFKGPISIKPWQKKLSPQDSEKFWRLGKENPQNRILGTLALYWTDGKRNLNEISKLVELETGRTDLHYLKEYYRLLREMGLIEYT
jgi:hypothetical protein